MATFVWNGSVDGDTTDASNWTPGGGPPGDTDTVIFPTSTTVAVDGNADFPAVSADGTGFERVIIEEGVTYNIGSRTTPLELYMDSDSATNSIEIGGTGIYFLTPKQYNRITITEAGSAPGEGLYALNLVGMLLGGTRTGAIDIRCESNQSIGIAAEANTLSEVDELYIFGGDVTLGVGVTLNDASAALPMVMSGGTLISKAAFTTAKISGGDWTQNAGGVSSSLTIDAGTVRQNGTGTLVSITIRENGTLDASEQTDGDSFTVTNDVELYAGATFLDPNAAGTPAVVFNLNQCRLEDVTVDLGPNRSITRGTI